MIKLVQLLKEEKFTAINKATGKTSVFKSKDSRDAAVKAGTHDKKEDGGEKEQPKGEKPNMFSKDAGYDAPDVKASKPEKAKAFNKDVDEKEFGDALEGDGFSAYSGGSLEGVSTFGDESGNTVAIAAGDVYDKKSAFVVSGYNDNDPADVQSKEFNSKKDAIAYAKELAQKLKNTKSDNTKSDDTTSDGYDVEKFPAADKEWYNAKTAAIESLTNADISANDLKNLFKARGFGDSDTIEKELDGLLTMYNDDSDFAWRVKNQYKMNKRQFIKRIEDLKTQLKSSSKDAPNAEPKPQRKGNPAVNKAAKAKAEKLGITPEKLGKDEYQKKMAQAAYEALTDANFHSEARELIAKLEGKPELAEKPDYPKMDDPKFDEKMQAIRTKYASEYSDDVEDDARDLGIAASQESGWDGGSAVDGIAFTLRMNGFHKLADTIQSVIKESKSTKLTSLIKK